MTPLQLAVLDNIREFIAVSGLSPSIREIARLTGQRVAEAHRVVTALVASGHLARTAERTRNLRVADAPDLRAVPSDVIAAELARRGVTFAALNPQAPRAVGQQVTCAADTCGAAVERGHLMCRRHWFALSAELRSRILQSNSRRDAVAFERAVTEARDLIDSGDWRARA